MSGQKYRVNRLCLFCFVLPMATSCLTAFAAYPDDAYVTGYVFEDVNNNGIRDKDESGIVGVLVSNQRDVVITDAEGRYTLPVKENMTIFVTKPAGYQFHMNEYRLPQFYYHHYPTGSPEGMRFDGIKPSGPLPKSLDFALVKIDESEAFTFMVIGDPQSRNHEDINHLRDAVIAALPHGLADFSITAGDLVHDDLSLLPRHNALWATLGIPWYNATGNHDINFDAEQGHCLDTFRSHYGPEYYAFTYGKTHFLVLNTVDYYGHEGARRHLYRGAISSEQLIWIENTLRHIPADDLIIFVGHIPLTCQIMQVERRIIFEREAFFELLIDRKHLLFLAGHMHTNEYSFLGPEEGWHGEAKFPHIICGAVSGTWWRGPKESDGTPVQIQPDGAPSGVWLFDVNGNQFKETFYPIRYGRDYQIAVRSPKGVIAHSKAKDTPILANVFAGNKYTSVIAHVNGVEIPMERTIQPDPFKAELVSSHPDKYYEWVQNRSISTQIWEARLPDNLTGGVYRIDITATLHDGRTYTGKGLFEIAEPVIIRNGLKSYK